MFTRIFGLAVLCLIGQNVIAEQQVAKDISAEIEDTDLAYATQLVNACAGGTPVPPISAYSAYSWQGHQSLAIDYDRHENTAARKARYSAEFDRETSNDQWKLYGISVSGEQTLAGQDGPVHFNGYLDSETFEKLTTYVAATWRASTSARFAIVGVITNRMPPVYCGADGSDAREIIYEVTIKNLSPRILPPPEPEPNTLVVVSSGSTDNTYKVRVTDVNSGRFLTTGVNCDSGAACDPELLARLRANLDRPPDSIEIEKALQDALAALPARLRGARVLSTQSLFLGTSEMFNVEFAETAVSQSRKEKSSVTCLRSAGTRDDWTCRHSVDHVTQQVSGQTRPISTMESMLSESDVEHIVSALRDQLAVHLDIGATVSDFKIIGISPHGGKFHSFVQCGNEFRMAVYTYDGQVKLESVDLLDLLPGSPGVRE